MCPWAVITQNVGVRFGQAPERTAVQVLFIVTITADFVNVNANVKQRIGIEENMLYL